MTLGIVSTIDEALDSSQATFSSGLNGNVIDGAGNVIDGAGMGVSCGLNGNVIDGAGMVRIAEPLMPPRRWTAR